MCHNYIGSPAPLQTESSQFHKKNLKKETHKKMKKTIWTMETRTFEWYMVCLNNFLSKHYEDQSTS